MAVYLSKLTREVRRLPQVTGEQILCGDCSGEGETPHWTLLRVDGLCNECGGSSYVLKARIADERARYFRSRTMSAVPQVDLAGEPLESLAATREVFS